MSESKKITLSEKLKIDFKSEGGSCFLSFTGDIDEDFKYDELLQNKFNQYKIDFNEVEMINSCGIREWINFIEKLESSQITYLNCPQVIVQQFNMVEGFLTDNSKVFSFYAPYYSEETDTEKKVLLKAQDIRDFKAPVVKDHEGNEMEFDAHEKQYFHFLNIMNRA